MSETTGPIRKRVRAGEGDTVAVTVQLPKALYEQIKQEADGDERTVPEYLRRQIRDSYAARNNAISMTPEAQERFSSNLR